MRRVSLYAVRQKLAELEAQGIPDAEVWPRMCEWYTEKVGA